MTTSLLDLPGAVAGAPPDAEVAAHYGDPYGEQRAAAAGCGIADRSHRGVVRVGGADRLDWLHSLTTQHLAKLEPWTGAETLVLSPHGHVEHHLQLADDGETCWLDVEPDTAPGLMAFLDSMRFLLRVDPEDVTAAWSVLSLAGPALPAVLDGAGLALPAAPYAVAAAPWGGFVRRMSWPLDPAADLLVPRPAAREAWHALTRAGATPLGSWGWEALRVADRRPRLGRETDHRTIPHEVGWIGAAVHLDKGCYRGQETVARVYNLGRPPRRLVLLHLDGSVDRLPGHGDPVTGGDGEPIGFVGTAARHHELGPIGLALVRQSTADSAELVAGGIPARVDPTVPAGARPQSRTVPTQPV